MRAFGMQMELLLVTPPHTLPFYFSTIPKCTVRYSSILYGDWRNWPHFPSHTAHSTVLWILLLAATWSASRRRNGYFGVPTTATDYFPTSDSHLGIYVQFSSNTRLCGMRHDRHAKRHPLAKLSDCIGRLQKNIRSVSHPVTGGGGLHHSIYKFIRLRNIYQFRIM